MIIISGGQTGADQAGWRAAKACGLETHGRMPKGWLTEEGCHPEFAALFGAYEFQKYSYPARTRANVYDADITLWMSMSDKDDSRGFHCTRSAAVKAGKPFMIINKAHPHWMLAETLRRYEVVNIAGSRESKSPGIGEWVERYLMEVFWLVATCPEGDGL